MFLANDIIAGIGRPRGRERELCGWIGIYIYDDSYVTFCQNERKVRVTQTEREMRVNYFFLQGIPGLSGGVQTSYFFLPRARGNKKLEEGSEGIEILMGKFCTVATTVGSDLSSDFSAIRFDSMTTVVSVMVKK